MILVGYILIIAAVYTVMGFITAIQFRKDKIASENGEWRIPEKQLLTLMWFFGVFGAAVGMRVFRHKTNKPLFQGSLALALLSHVVLIYFLISIAA